MSLLLVRRDEIADDELHGSVATRGVLAKSLLGNRFVGQHPSVHAAAADVGCAEPTATIGRAGWSEETSANKAIPEERLGRGLLDSAIAAAERLGRPQADSSAARQPERLA